jgi:hypothetical protein
MSEEQRIKRGIKPGSHRWWRKWPDGTIQRISRRSDRPPPVARHGEPVWSRGLGRFPTEEQKRALGDALRGVPKTEEHKQKLRDAKLGKPKTDTHRKNMSEAHKQRVAKLHKIMAEHSVKWSEACKILKESKNAG